MSQPVNISQKCTSLSIPLMLTTPSSVKAALRLVAVMMKVESTTTTAVAKNQINDEMSFAKMCSSTVAGRVKDT